MVPAIFADESGPLLGCWRWLRVRETPEFLFVEEDNVSLDNQPGAVAQQIVREQSLVILTHFHPRTDPQRPEVELAAVLGQLKDLVASLVATDQFLDELEVQRPGFFQLR